jgi:glycosyltransferase involved in cell wall biosynthesis
MESLSLLAGPLSPVRPDQDAAISAARATEFGARQTLVPAQRVAGPGRSLPARLRVAYLMPRTGIGGGARVLIEHANRLTERGHEVVLLSHFDRPDWTELRAEFRRVPFGVELAEAIPPCDLIICGYWEQVVAARALGTAPVVHFEQGDFHLFEELARKNLATVAAQLSSADATMTVSGTVAEVLSSRYGVEARVVPNAIDPKVFHQGSPAPTARPYLLFVGWDGNEFKGMAEMRQVYAALRAERPELDLVWVSPQQPQQPLGRVVVAPEQAALAELFRGAAAYVCCSHYEAFPLPPIEAMASGTPVIATRNVGVLEYARDGVNALLADIGDVAGLTANVRRVLDDAELAAQLRQGGLETAAAYTWDTIIDGLEEFYRATAADWTAPQSDGWTFELDGLTFVDDDGAARLRTRATAVGTREIAIPVSFPAFEGHRISRWQVVARRPYGEPGVSRLLVQATTEAAPRNLPYRHGLRHFNEGRFDDALQRFVTTYKGSDDAGMAAVARWMVITLLELDRGQEAHDIAAGYAEKHADNADFHYLHAMTSVLTGRKVDGPAFVETLGTLGPATHYDEWFDDIVGLGADRLLGLAPDPEPTPAPLPQEVSDVLLRQPLATPLQSRHDPYFVQQVKVSRSLVGVPRTPVLSQLLAGKRVLHVGYADWPITDPSQNLHVQLDAVCAQLDGIDPNDDAAEVLRPLVRGKLLTDWADVTDSYDVVLVPEVLEHVADMDAFFKQLSSVDFTSILITVPDAFSCSTGHFEYDDTTETFTEVVHPDHNVWFTPYTLYNVITKHTDWNVDGLWFFNGISILAACSKAPQPE